MTSPFWFLVSSPLSSCMQTCKVRSGVDWELWSMSCAIHSVSGDSTQIMMSKIMKMMISIWIRTGETMDFIFESPTHSSLACSKASLAWFSKSCLSITCAQRTLSVLSLWVTRPWHPSLPLMIFIPGPSWNIQSMISLVRRFPQLSGDRWSSKGRKFRKRLTIKERQGQLDTAASTWI